MRLFLNCVVTITYSAFHNILVSCPAFIKKLKPYTRKEITFIPQWEPEMKQLPQRPPDGKRIFTFAGNVGSVQNLEKVIQAFGNLKNENAELRIVGGGVFLERIKKLVEDSNYQNIVLTGRRPREEMEHYFSESDIMIISLTEKFDLTIPAKFQAYIATGRPIYGIIRGDTAQLIEQHCLGITADPADINSIADGFKKMCSVSNQQLHDWGNQAILLSQKMFDRESIIRRIESFLA